MTVEILLENGVILPLLGQCSKVLLHQGNDKVSAKLHRYNRVSTCAGKDKCQDFVAFKQQTNKNAGLKKKKKKKS